MACAGKTLYIDNVGVVQLQQMMNLVINSRDAIKENGLVVCSVKNMMMDAARCNACYEAFSGRFNASAGCR